MKREDIIALFCCIDDFCKMYEECHRNKLLPVVGTRNREGKLRLSEMLTIMIMYHLSGFRDFKTYYLYGINYKYKGYFKDLPCYPRYVSLMKKLLVPLSILLHGLKGEETGIYVADSTHLAVCHNRRINRNKVFAGIAERGKTTMGWFYGLKLHVVINHKGEIMAVKITRGNTDDRSVLEDLTKRLTGTIYADKGYISQILFQKLYYRGLRLITGIRKNMQSYLMPLIDKILLRKRFIVESAFNIMKNHMNLEHTRHRSVINSFVNIIACLVAYSFRTNKPAFKSSFLLIRN